MFQIFVVDDKNDAFGDATPTDSAPLDESEKGAAKDGDGKPHYNRGFKFNCNFSILEVFVLASASTVVLHNKNRGTGASFT